MFEHTWGEVRLWRFVDIIYCCVLADPVLRPLFGAGNLRITEEQRQRFIELYMAAADKAGLPGDRPFRDALRSHVEFGSRVATRNSHARSDDELHPLREGPRWRWDGE